MWNKIEPVIHVNDDVIFKCVVFLHYRVKNKIYQGCEKENVKICPRRLSWYDRKLNKGIRITPHIISI